MSDNPFTPKSEEQAAVDLIDRNVSFDFKSFLGKVVPTPSAARRTSPATEDLRTRQERPRSAYVRETFTK
jgi:hypothetical protein